MKLTLYRVTQEFHEAHEPMSTNTYLFTSLQRADACAEKLYRRWKKLIDPGEVVFIYLETITPEDCMEDHSKELPKGHPFTERVRIVPNMPTTIGSYLFEKGQVKW